MDRHGLTAAQITHLLGLGGYGPTRIRKLAAGHRGVRVGRQPQDGRAQLYDFDRVRDLLEAQDTRHLTACPLPRRTIRHLAA